MMADLWYLVVNVVRSALVAAATVGGVTFVVVLVGGTVKEAIDFAKIGWWR